MKITLVNLQKHLGQDEKFQDNPEFPSHLASIHTADLVQDAIFVVADYGTKNNKVPWHTVNRQCVFQLHSAKWTAIRMPGFIYMSERQLANLQKKKHHLVIEKQNIKEYVSNI